MAKLLANTRIYGNATIDANAAIGNVLSDGLYHANGAPWIVQEFGIANYLATYNGSLTANNITVANNFQTKEANITGTTITGNLVVFGTITGGGNGNISISPYSNANVIAFLPTYTGNLVSLTGDVTTTANVSASYLLGNGRFITGLPAGYSNANVANYLPTYTGNVNANYFLGNGAFLTGLPASYSNANVANYLPTYAGNVSAGYFLGSGYYLTDIQYSNLVGAYSNTNVFNYLPVYGGPVAANIIYANSQTASDPFQIATQYTNIGNAGGSVLRVVNTGSGANVSITAGGQISHSSGNLSLTSNTTVTGNLSATSFVSANNISVTTDLTVGGNAYVQANLHVIGNVVALQYVDLEIGNVDIILAANATTPGQANGAGIVANGAGASFLYNSIPNSWVSSHTIRAPSLVATGNAQANFFVGNGRFLTGIASSDSVYTNANVNSYLQVFGGSANIANIYNANIVQNYLGPLKLQGGDPNMSVDGTTLLLNNSKSFSLLNGINAGIRLNEGSNVFSIELNDIINSSTTPSTFSFTTYFDNDLTQQFSFLTFPDGTKQYTAYGPGNAYSNANVAAYLPTYTGNLRSLAGNVTTTANVQGAYILGNGAFLTGLPTQYSNANVANYLPTYTGNLVSLTGNIITTANISANYILGNGAFITGLPATYSNANVANYLPINTSNVSANYFLGNGAFLTGFEKYSNSNVANYLPTYTGNLASLTGNVTTTANVSANAFTAAGSGNLNIVSSTGNIVLSPTGIVATDANISSNYFLGNGRFLTGLVSSDSLYSNANVANYLVTYGGNILASNVTTLLGVTAAGNITTSGNLSASYILANGAFLTGLPAGYSNSNVASYLANYTGNIQAGNLSVTANANIVGNLYVGNIIANGQTITATSAGGANLTLQYNSASSFAGDTSLSIKLNNISATPSSVTGGVTYAPGTIYNGMTQVVSVGSTYYALAGGGPTISPASATTVLYSSTDNGITWNQIGTLGYIQRYVYSGTAIFLLNVAYGGGRFVAISGGTAYSTPFFNTYTSTDFINWTNQGISNPVGGQAADFTYGERFVLVNPGAVIYTTTTGASWTNITVANLTYRRVKYGGGRYIATANSASYATSTDGVTWSTTSSFPTTGDYTGLAYGAGTWVALNYDNANGYYSTNGTTWSSITLPQAGTWSRVEYSSGIFLAVSGNARAAYSTNGINWTATTLENKPYVGLAGTANSFFAVATNGSVGGQGGYTINSTRIPVSTTGTVAGLNVNGIINTPAGTGTAGQVLTSAGNTASVTWANVPTQVAGSNTQIQYNNSGTFGANSLFTYNQATNTLSATNIAATALTGALTGNVIGNVAGNLIGNSFGNLTGNVLGTTATFSGNVSVANLIVSANILATGNVSGAYVYGNGYFLSGLNTNPYSNANVAAFLPTYSGNLVSIGGNITTPANVQANSVITDRVAPTLNTLTLAGNVAVTGLLVGQGNINSTYFFGNGYYLTGIPQAYGNSNVADYLTVYNGNILAANIAAGNVSTTGNVNALGITSGNITATSTVAANRLQATGTGTLAITSDGDITFLAANGAGNLTFSGNVTTGSYTATGNAYAANAVITGNVTAAYFVGNGYYLTGLNIPAGYSNANVANYLPTYTGNVGAGNVNLVGSGDLNIVSATGNIVLSPTDTVVTTANVSANYFLGNGAFLTGLPATYSNANVANYLAVLTSNVTTAANVQASYLIGNISAATGGYNDSNVSAYLPSYIGSLPLLGGNVITQANVQGSYILGNGSFLTGVLTSASLYSNSNVASYLPTYTGNLASLAGDVTTTANVSANYFLGNGAFLTGLPTQYSNSNVAGYLPTYSGTIGNATSTVNIGTPSITSTFLQVDSVNQKFILSTNDIPYIANVAAFANLNSTQSSIQSPLSVFALTSTGNVTASANVSANYFLGNGSQLTGLNFTNYSNANVAAYLPTYTGNLQAGNVLVNGVTTFSGNVVITANLRVDGNTTTINANTLNVADKDIIIANGAVLPSDANGGGIIINGANLSLIYISASNTFTLTHAFSVSNNITTTSNVTAAGITSNGNVTANYFLGNGSQLTGLPATYSNANVANYLAVLTSNVTTTANIQGNYILGNGAFLTGISTGGSSYSNANVANYLPTYSGNLVSLTGNVTTTANTQAANLVAVSNVFTPGLVGIGTGNLIVTSSNGIVIQPASSWNTVVSSNLIVSGNVTTTANVSAGYILGNGAFLTGISAGASTYGNANVANYLPTYTGNLVSLIGNVITTANVTGNYFLGNGAFLTGITAGSNYSNSNVANYLPTYSGNLVSLTGNVTTTANVSAGYILGNGSQLTGLNFTNYSNANVANYLASNSNVTITAGTGAITTQGNISANTVTLTGALSASARTIAINTTLTATDYFVGVNAASNVTITLPTGTAGRILVIKDQSGTLSSGKVITISGSIDNLASLNLTQPYNSVTLVYQGAQWWLT